MSATWRALISWISDPECVEFMLSIFILFLHETPVWDSGNNSKQVGITVQRSMSVSSVMEIHVLHVTSVSPTDMLWKGATAVHDTVLTVIATQTMTPCNYIHIPTKLPQQTYFEGSKNNMITCKQHVDLLTGVFENVFTGKVRGYSWFGFSQKQSLVTRDRVCLFTPATSGGLRLT